MKKLTVHVRLHKLFLLMLKKYITMDKVASIDALEILKVDFERGYKLVLIRVDMKEGYTYDDFKLGGKSEILYVLENKGTSFIALVRGEPPKYLMSKFKNLGEKFDMDVIWDTPTRMNQDEVVFSVIGEEAQLKKIVTYMKLIGTVEQISFTSSFLDGLDMLSFLTEKQRHVMIAAKKHGYYEYPRKINSEQLSKRVGISKATTVEHLRKAEQRIMNHYLAGY